MNDKNTDTLFKKYPKLFPKENRKDPMKSLMCFGFECGNGWFTLLDHLFYQLKDFEIEVVQVKEKYGGLRVYTNGGTGDTHSAISLAESLSYTICEDCGASPANPNEDGYITTLCKECRRRKQDGVRKAFNDKKKTVKTSK